MPRGRGCSSRLKGFLKFIAGIAEMSKNIYPARGCTKPRLRYHLVCLLVNMIGNPGDRTIYY